MNDKKDSKKIQKNEDTQSSDEKDERECAYVDACGCYVDPCCCSYVYVPPAYRCCC